MAARAYGTEKDFRKAYSELILMQPGRLRVPKTMSLKRDDRTGFYLEWDWLSETKSPLPDKGLLRDFWQLKYKDKPTNYLKFAKCWGPLGLCEKHGKPCTHKGECQPLESNSAYSEPISGWQKYAKKFEAAVYVAYRNTEGEKCTWKEWKLIGGSEDAWPELLGDSTPELRISSQALKLAETVNTWLRDGDVRPQVKLADKPLPCMHAGLGSYPLFGTLTWLLAKKIFSGHKPVFCAGCFRLLNLRQRAPKKGQKSWCPECSRNGTRDRIRQREYYVR